MAFTFAQKVNTIVKLLREPKTLAALLSQRDFGYLKEVGWFESFSKNRSIDKDFNPIPWFTYPSIDFLAPRLNKSIKMLEFGSGNSTIYFASKVSKVYSVEHNKIWFDIVSKSRPANAEILLSESDGVDDYISLIEKLDLKFDIIVIDGLHRNECMISSINLLSQNAVVILDDSERDEYQKGIGFLLSKDFRKLDFWGIAPTVLFKKCTSIFYKSNNSLEI